MTKIHQLADLGQAIWLDYIRRSFIVSGDLQTLVDDGLRGVTSNPTIFEKAIAGSTDYDDALHRLVEEGKAVEEIYEMLALDAIQRAASDVAHLAGDDGRLRAALPALHRPTAQRRRRTRPLHPVHCRRPA
ncbi:MAG: transaldolase family protein [Anaerolineae bacterium]